MNVYAPAYYKNFTCIADKCKHNCCIGWEIDIDDFTYERYNQIDGDLGKLLNENIIISDDNIPSFKLREDERCPFLLENNLCRIIVEKGEDLLCDICTDHPRFRNFWSDRTEIGLGLCCEEAARIILSDSSSDVLEIIEETEEEASKLSEAETEILAFRQQIFEILIDNSMKMSQRFNIVLSLFNTEPLLITNKEISKLYLPLERLDNSWTELLTEFSNYQISKFEIIDSYPNLAQKLATYFIYRHLAGALDDERITERVIFSLMSAEVILRLSKFREGNFSTFFEAVIETARAYSGEIEYSQENVERLIS